MVRAYSRGLSAAVLLFFGVSIGAQAALITETYFGEVTETGGSNPFGVAAGDTLTLSITYNDLAPIREDTFGTEYRALASMDFTMGNTVLNERDDRNYPDYPRMLYDNGEFIGVSYYVEGQGFNALSLLRDQLTVWNYSWDVMIGGVMHYHPGTPVPLPAGIWLFLSGLLGLSAYARRKG